MHRHSLIHKAFRRTVEAAVLLLVGVFLGAGSATAVQDGPIAPPSDRRVQDDQDDLGLSSRGAGRLADSQQDLSSEIGAGSSGRPPPRPGRPSAATPMAG